MGTKDFWHSIKEIISNGYTSDGLLILDEYAEQFIDGRIIFKRFSQAEQHGCATGGATHVVATLVAAAETASDPQPEGELGFKREVKLAQKQAQAIERWARKTGLWIDNAEDFLTSKFGMKISEGGEAKVFDHGSTFIKSIGLDYIQPILALDRISLHNTLFPETRLEVLGFGNHDGEFKIIVEQPFIEGHKTTDEEIREFMTNMGFELINPRNWTYATKSLYLSDMHDENVIKSSAGTMFVIDCDIRINVPELRAKGSRKYSFDISTDPF